MTKLLLICAWILSCAATSLSQKVECLDEQPAGHKVRSVKVKARWLPDDLDLPMKKGDDFTPEKLDATRMALIAAISAEQNKYAVDFVKLERVQLVDVNFVRGCGRKLPAATCQAEGLGTDCVDVEFRSLALSTNPVFMAATLLPMPRSSKVMFLSGVPRLLRMFDPKFGMSADREFGATPQFNISTDLLSLGEVSQGKPAKARPVELLLKANGGKSLSEPFYTSDVKLSLVLKQPTQMIESLGVEASFTADHEPQLDASYLRNSFRIGGHAAFNMATGMVNRLALNGGYRRSSNRFDGINRLLVTENSYDGSAIVDGRILNGFTRAGLWLDGGKPENREAYHRVAGLIGYEKELPIGKDQTIGIEALFGAGKASKDAPEYNLFYGGNTLADFIYQEIGDSENVSFIPSGPILRGYGRNQAGFRLPNGSTLGAHSYQHLNLTIAIPIPSLSAPLIPKEEIDEDGTTLADVIELAVNTGQDSLSGSYQDEGLSSDEADAKAAKVFSEIRPGVKYLTDYAKIYSLKPLLMFDEARLSRSDFNGAQYRYSAGGGLQLTIVVAKFQVGYMHAINRFPGEKRGNVIFRLAFTNLF